MMRVCDRFRPLTAGLLPVVMGTRVSRSDAGQRGRQRRSLGLPEQLFIWLAGTALFALAMPGLAAAVGVSAPTQITPRYGAGATGVTVGPQNPDFTFFRLKNRPSRFTRLYSSGVSSQPTSEHGLGYVPPPLLLGSGSSAQDGGDPIAAPAAPDSVTSTATPRSFDLRTQNKLTPVRDQGTEGCCWAFATFGSLESFLMPNESADFSEDHLALGSGFHTATSTADELYNGGGNDRMSTAYLARWAGPVNESDEPYRSGFVPGLSARRHVQNVVFLPDRTLPTSATVDALNAPIKQALMTYGAVWTDFYADTTHYYRNSTYAYYYDGAEGVNHAVTIVGWNDDFPASSFLTSDQPPANGAWIVRNSWGPSWGQAGYFYVSYYDSQFANHGNSVFDSAESSANYDHILQYDTLGPTSHFGWSTGNTAWFMNKFKVDAKSHLSAVSFYSNEANSPYVVYASTGGSLSQLTSGTLTDAGYHTVPLPASVPISAGSTLSVAVKLTQPGDAYPYDIESPIVGYADQATATAGQGFVSRDGVSWSDVTSFFASTSVPVKAFLSDGATPTTTVSGIPGGWTNGNVTFSLAATTTSGGIANTYYSINSGAVATYTAPVSLSSEGTTTISYYSIGTLGDAEPTKTAQVKIDKTPPATSDNHVATYTVSATVSLSVVDTASGVARTDWLLDGTPGSGTTVTTSAVGTHTLVFWSTDVAGNAETSKTVTFSVRAADTDAPVTTSDGQASYTDAAVIHLTATDVGWGVSRTDWQLDGVSGSGTTVSTSRLGNHVLKFWSTDLAGNAEATKTLSFSVVLAPGKVIPGTNVATTLPTGESFVFARVDATGTVTCQCVSVAQAAPTGRVFVAGGYYQIHTDAAFGGNVTVRLRYSQSALAGYSANDLRLLHYTGGQWVDITSSVDPVTQTVTGVTPSFSDFALALPSGDTPPVTTSTPASSPVSLLVLAVAALGLAGAMERKSRLG